MSGRLEDFAARAVRVYMAGVWLVAGAGALVILLPIAAVSAVLGPRRGPRS